MPYYRITASNHAHWATYRVQAETPAAAVALLTPELIEAEAEDRDQCADDACRQRDWTYRVSDRDVTEIDAADLTAAQIAAAAAGPACIDSGGTGGAYDVDHIFDEG